MQLSQHTDSALRLPIYLAAQGDRAATVPEVAGSYGISSTTWRRWPRRSCRGRA